MALGDELDTYTDAAAGFSLPVPRGWEYVEHPATEVRFVAVEPLAEQGFRTSLVVTVDELPEGLSIADWQDGVDRLLPSMMDGWQLIDRSAGEAADGSSAILRLGHHVLEQTAAVTLRQVAVLQGSTGVTLSISVWTPAYSDSYAVLRQIEDGFTVAKRGGLGDAEQSG